MPDAIESRTFRSAARRNCIMYLGIPIYMANVPEMQKLALPTYRAQSPTGAVSQLFSTLVNMNTMIEQVRKSLRMSDSKPVPGVTYDDISGISMSLSGDVYFENARQYKEFTGTVSRIAGEYGWRQSVSETMSCAVYHPAKNSFTNSDPVQAAVKGMVLHSFSDVGDALTVATTSEKVAAGSNEERSYFAARDRLLGSSIFDTAAIQYYSNTPLTIQQEWSGGLGSSNIPTLYVEGRATDIKTNISYMPTGMTVTPGAFVADNTGFYPTKCSVSIQMENPLGGLLANFTNEKANEAQDSGTSLETTPDNYLGATKERY